MKFIEMFSGVGGNRLGLEKAQTPTRQNLRSKGNSTNNPKRNPWKHFPTSQDNGFQCVWANDNDKYACKVYRKNFGAEELVEADIKTVDADSIPDHDLLTAGFPCQSFSVAGKRKGFQDTRGTLFFDIARVVEAKRPKIILLENVKGLLSAQKGYCFFRIVQTLDELGYDVEWQVLNSKHFGVPQNRERVFIIGHSRAEPTKQIFPIGEPNQILTQNEKVGRRIASCLDANYYRGARKQRQFVMQLVGDRDNPSVSVKDEAFCLPSNPMSDRQQAVIEVANAVDCDGYLRFGERPRDKDGKPQLLPIGYRRIRRLTPKECERLQGFPDGWTEGVSDTQRYKLLGNAVTVNVVKFLGELLA